MDNISIQCKEFLGCAFSSNSEAQHLVTLSGEGDWCAIVWLWEQKKMLAKVDILVSDPHDIEMFQISMAHIMSDPVCVVTGPNTYQYFKLVDHLRNFDIVHSQLSDEVS